MKNESRNTDKIYSKEFYGFLIYLSKTNETLFNLFCVHITLNNGNLWIELDPDRYSEEESDLLYQMWDDYHRI